MLMVCIFHFFPRIRLCRFHLALIRALLSSTNHVIINKEGGDPNPRHSTILGFCSARCLCRCSGDCLPYVLLSLKPSDRLYLSRTYPVPVPLFSCQFLLFIPLRFSLTIFLWKPPNSNMRLVSGPHRITSNTLSFRSSGASRRNIDVMSWSQHRCSHNRADVARDIRCRCIYRWLSTSCGYCRTNGNRAIDGVSVAQYESRNFDRAATRWSHLP